MNKTLKKLNKRTDEVHKLFEELSRVDSKKIDEEFMTDLSVILSSLKEDIDDMTLVFFPSPYETFLKKIENYE